MKAVAMLLMVSAGLFAADSSRRVAEGGVPVDTVKSKKSAAGAARYQTQQLPPGPVIPQIYRPTAAWGVVAENLPPGVVIMLVTVSPDGQAIEHQPIRYDEGLSAGFSIQLPTLDTLGPLWTKGVWTYHAVVTMPDKTELQRSGDFTTGGYYRNEQERSELIPLILSSRFVRTDGRLTLEISGRFTSDAPVVIVEDMVVPRDAILSTSADLIRVNVDAVPQFPKSDLADYLLTVAQGGWADTLPIRYLP